MSGAIVTVEQNNWQNDVLNSPLPVLVDFWAEWCAPCRAVAPVLAELSTEMAGSLRIAKVNVDQHPELAGQFSVRSIPTMILLKQGKEAGRLVGLMSKPQLKAKLEPLLK